jgi:Ion channel
MEDGELYLTSFYFTVTTIVTVGYGDITAVSKIEKIVSIFLMITGVVAFSFATGILASIVQNQDSSEAKLKEQMSLISEINTEYEIGEDLFNRLVKTVRYDHSRKQKNFKTFIDELPVKLKIELAAKMHQKMYSNVTFFKKRERSFMAWIGTVIRPINVQEADTIFSEGEPITEIYFIVKGTVCYVLPRYNNKDYLEIG